MNPPLAPGEFVLHPERPDWEIGRVQPVAGDLVTANFEEAGKVVVNSRIVELAPEGDPPRSGSAPSGHRPPAVATHRRAAISRSCVRDE